MLERFLALTLNQRLALLASGLGFVSLGARVDRGNVVTLDVKELALAVEKEADHVAPLELADWIIKEKTGYRLVDLRGAEAYAGYHIPTADNVTVAELPNVPFARNETLVLYSEGGTHAAQAWLLMRAKGYRSVVAVKGGLEGWKQDVLFPAVPENAGPDSDRVQAVSRFFGGRPRSGAAAALSELGELPKVAPPPPTAKAGGSKRAKRDGC